MLEHIELAGFKAFPGPERIRLSPITLIFGPNSSGKSSIVQSLLLLKQSVEQAENPEALLSPKGNFVDLGGYREFAYCHDVRNPVSFKLGFQVPEKELSTWLPFPVDRIPGGRLGVRVSFGYDESNDATELRNFDLYAGDYDRPVIGYVTDEAKERAFKRSFGFAFRPPGHVSRTVLRAETADFEHPFWRIIWEIRKQIVEATTISHIKSQLADDRRRLERLEFQKHQLRNQGDPSRLKLIDRQIQQFTERISQNQQQLERMRAYTFETAIEEFQVGNAHSFLTCRNFLPSEINFDTSSTEDPTFEVGGAAGLAIAASNMMRLLLQQLIYIGPLRDKPERHYIYSGTFSEQVGKTGKLLPEILYSNKHLISKVNEQFEKFELGYKLEIASAGQQRELQDVFALRLVDKILGANVSIVDVGFGISQVLPIIVQSLLSTSRTLCLEQPEIHLHPKLQTQLGSLFAEAIKPPHNNRFIIETHSEHLILRLQRLVRQGEIPAEALSIVFVDRTPDGSRCIPLRLDKSGEFLDRWPEGFFEESYREMFW